MTFSGDLNRFRAKLSTRERDIFVGSVAEAHRSIVSGSEITGSEGQPVDTGTLRNSWQTIFEGPHVALIATNLDYALPIEAGTTHGRKMTLRSQVGGFHSVKKTIAGMRRIVEAVRQRVVSS